MDEQPAPSEAPPATRRLPNRLKWLIAASLLIAVAPPLLARFDQADWFAGPIYLGVPMAVVMLLSFWAGMVARSPARVLFALLAASLYLAAATMAAIIGPTLFASGNWSDGFEDLSYIGLEIFALWGVYAGINFAMALVVSLAFLVVRRRVACLQRVGGQQAPATAARTQISLRGLLLATCVIAVVLGLSRATTSNQIDDAVRSLASATMQIIITLAIALGAAWATLGSGSVARRVGAISLAAVLLCGVLALQPPANATPEFSTWLDFLSEVLLFLIPLALFTAALLVIRCCGYRLVPVATAAETSVL